MRIKRPQVAILGRPNVGKSTLFNILTRSRKSLVRNEPGVTRDILIETAEWWGKSFDVVDTGGLTEAPDLISTLIKTQVAGILSGVDLLVVVVDGRAGFVPEDKDVVTMAQESGKPFVILVNKVDRQQDREIAKADFYQFSADIIATSFEKHDHVDEVVEWILARIPEAEVDERDLLRLTIVGKPNVGKSRLCNLLLGEQRMLVSAMAGTTVDPVEAVFTYREKDYILVDTAGIRRPSKRKSGIESLSAVKTEESVRRSDLVLLMIDATQGPTEQDAKMLENILQHHKAVICVANKSDLAREENAEYRAWFRDRLNFVFHFFPDIPVVFTSAVTSLGVIELFERIENVWEKLNIRIPTSKLNKFFYEVIRQAPSPVCGTRNVKFYYLTQTHQRPPSFIAFANLPDGVTPSYRRFIAKRLQQEWGLEGIPVRIFILPSGEGRTSSRDESAHP